MSEQSVFLNQQLVRGSLYQDQQRLADRTGALLSAKVAGRPAPEVISRHALKSSASTRGLLLDIGCGRGASTLALARVLPDARIVAVDASASLLAATRRRLEAAGVSAHTARADFHHLPVGEDQAVFAVAAFCLYHSPRPEDVLREIARCTRPGGTVLLATKAADSYASLDHLVADTGLDAGATSRPSLYQAFHSGNLEAIAARVLEVREVTHEEHQFRFRSLDHTAAYLATSPKYRLPTALAGNPGRIATHLHRRLPDGPVDTTSVVSYLTATVPA